MRTRLLSILTLLLVSCFSVNLNRIETFNKIKVMNKQGKSIKLETGKEEKNELLTEVDPIQGSPFSVVRVEDKYFLALGKYRLTELNESKEDILATVNDVDWNRLLAVMNVVATEVFKEEYEKMERGGKDSINGNAKKHEEDK